MPDFKSCSLKELLSHKTMYYDEIDYTTIEKSWEIVKKDMKVPFVIHLVGTNGKGSTGRFLAHYLNKIGKNVLHYSSPHIKKFNERIWIRGEDISDLALENVHKELQKILTLDLLNKLTYFEYTTLLALYESKGRDYLVLEAGLGGEFDATNVIKNDLSLVTTIDIDHVKFLGNSVKEIAFTKLKACDKEMILGHQVHKKVLLYAQDIQKERKYSLKEVEKFDVSSVQKLINFPSYLLKNLDLSLSALKHMKLELDLEIFSSLVLKGRCEKLNNLITVDVGHNPLAAKELLSIFKNKKINLVYNSYADKDYTEVLTVLKPIIKEVEILQIDDNRMIKETSLIKVCENLNIITKKFTEINEEVEYLVFGSFLVVEKFMGIYER